MRKISCLVLMTCSLSMPLLATAAQTVPDIEAKVREAAGKVMQRNNIPGMAIAVTANGKQSFYNFGITSRDAPQQVSSDTLFEVGSISKLFTATLATYAQANGQLSLSDHPGKYLPELKGSAFDKVTLLNLATHTAGGFPLQVPDEVQNNEQLMAYLKNWQPQYAPGSGRTYANPSIGMLGMITAMAMQMPFEQAMQQHVFSGLGLSNSYLNVPADKRSLYAQGYTRQDVPARLTGGVLGDEAYGVRTSSKDLIRFVEANIDPAKLGPVLGRAVADTQVGYFTSGPITQDLIWEQYAYPVKLQALLEGNSPDMAYKTQPAQAITPPLAAQQSAWLNKTGATNGFGAYVAFIPAKKIGVVILANKNYPNEDRVKLAYQILSELD
ncbi:beta-lactamase [Paucimonas lemoignei]|nr:beta-lactamase [Paucimonas lemoignei]